jgi:hypothetical protein
MKKSKKTVRFSIGFRGDDWQVLEKAIQARYMVKNVFAETSAQERCHFIKLAVYAIASAVIRQRVSMCMLACDLRPETEEEMARRVGTRMAKRIRRYRGEAKEERPGLPDNIVPLFPAA